MQLIVLLLDQDEVQRSASRFRFDLQCSIYPRPQSSRCTANRSRPLRGGPERDLQTAPGFCRLIGYDILESLACRSDGQIRATYPFLRAGVDLTGTVDTRFTPALL